jgi:excisionase family DNA binding protein
VERKTISIMKACELVGVSRRTIYNWLSSGKIEYVRTAGGSVRIFVDTLWRDPNNSERPACRPCGRRKAGIRRDAAFASASRAPGEGPMDEAPELRLLFHR